MTSTQSDVQNVTQRNEQALEQLRAKFGALVPDVALSNFDWRALMETGALACLRVSRYRGNKALTAEDLGLSPEDVEQANKIVALGHRLLLPKDVLNAFNSVETRSRQILAGYTLRTPAGLFLPPSAYDACSAAMTEQRAKFMALVDQLIDDLPTHRETVRQSYHDLGNQTYNRLLAQNLIAYGLDRYTFIDQFVDRCMALFPTVDDLRRSFAFDLRLEFVPMPYQQAQAETPQYAAASDDLLKLRRAVLEDQERARAELVNGFVTSVQSELYGLVNQALGDVLSSIQSNGALQSRSVVQLKGIVEKIGTLNFWQDRRLETIQQEIMAMLDRPAAKRDLDLDSSLLAEMQNETKFMLYKLEQVERGDLSIRTETQSKAPALPATDRVKLAPAPSLPGLPAMAPSNGRGSKLF